MEEGFEGMESDYFFSPGLWVQVTHTTENI